jgi:nucleoside-diphosphate-sugar epimerase
VTTVLVTGATGFVGGYLALRLAAEGFTAIGLARSGAEGPGRRVVRAWDEASLGEALRGVDVVVHAASVVHRPGAAMDEYRRFNVEGTRALAAAAKSQGVKRAVFLSSIKVHGEELPGGRIDETTPPSAEGGYAQTKVDAERILEENAAAGGPRVTILRLCPVFGRGDKGNVRRVITAIARRRFLLPGDGTTRKSIVHVSTIGDVVVAAIRKDKDGVFVVADREAPSMRELADTVASVVGARRPFSIPATALRAVAIPVEMAFRALGREPPVSRMLIAKSMLPSICVVDRTERELGVECHVDLRAAIADEVAWLRSEGAL